MAKILICEDEPNLRVLLARLLGGAGHDVATAATGTAALQQGLSESYDLVLLDLLLPDLPGENVLRVLTSAKSDQRVMILSSVTETNRRVGVLDAGASDFVAKPFVNSELLARIRARLRDMPTGMPPAEPPDGSGIRLDMERRALVVGNRRIELSQREFVLLAHLINRRGEVCSREELLSQVWGIGFDPGTNVVDVYVRRLRAKLAANSIETVRNVGYRLVAC